MSKNTKTILFQGDSITDCGRRDNPNKMGNGYALMAAELLEKDGYVCINRGISGDRASNLKNRWTEDCIELKPDIVSILIGINDTWRRYDNNSITTAEEYCNNYREILTRIKNELPGTKVLILEPFLLETPADRKSWREDLDPKINCARELAREFKTAFIPLDGLLAKHSITMGMEAICADGVHPTEAGHRLIAGYIADEIRSMM